MDEIYTHSGLGIPSIRTPDRTICRYWKKRSAVWSVISWICLVVAS